MNLHRYRFFKRRLFAVHVCRDNFVRQRALYKNHLTVRTVRNALRLDIERLDGKQVWQVVLQDWRDQVSSHLII